MSRLRAIAKRLASTPFHPQWLVPRDAVPDGLSRANGVVLDIGAADRWIHKHLNGEAHYVALDYPATGRDLYAASPDVYADGAALPFKDSTIDVVACFEVMEHVRYPDRVLQEIARVLRPGGQAFLSMPFLYPVHDAPHDYQRWTEYGWRRSAIEAGLTCMRIRPTTTGLEAAAALACLSLAAPLEHRHGFGKWVALLALGLLLPSINITAWLLARLWPAWPAASHGLRVELVKP